MIGFNLIGYSALAEIDRHQVQILVPVLIMGFDQTPPLESTFLEVASVEVEFDLGGIGDTLIGDTAIGEGRTVTKLVDQIPRLSMFLYPPDDIQAGVQIELPSAIMMTIQLANAEIQSRRRRLKTQVILS